MAVAKGNQDDEVENVTQMRMWDNVNDYRDY